jgi:hypothetical protein
MYEIRPPAVAVITAGIFALFMLATAQAQVGTTGSPAAKPPIRTAELPGATLATVPKLPTTPLELLQNIKFALDQGLPLREDFYAEANLKRIFGGSKVERVTDDPTAGPNDIVRQVSDFGAMAEPVKVGTSTISAITLVLHRSVASDGKISAMLTLDLLRPAPNLDFDHVTRVFGPNWSVPKKPKLPHMKPAPARQAHGNAEIEYMNADADNEFTFNPDAILGAAVFVLNARK